MKKLCAIRGAITAENTKESIEKQTVRLIKEIEKQNDFKTDDVVSVCFSLTKDLDQYNPASALRKNSASFNFDVNSAALFCTQEAYIEDGLKNCIRVLITGYFNKKKINFVYLDEAAKLRPDILK